MRVSLYINDKIIETELHSEKLNQLIVNSVNPNNTLQKILLNGIIVNDLFPPDTISCSCCSIAEKFGSSVDKFERLVDTGGNSSKNGKLCEIIANSDFKKEFPDVEYIDTSGIDRSGDAIVTLDSYKIMIDYKNYDQPVPGSETDKLVRDLKANDMELGILFSTKSKITRHNIIGKEIIDGKLIVFVACQGINAFVLMMTLKFIIHLHEANVVTISDKVYEQSNKVVSDKIIEIYTELFELGKDISRYIEKMDEVSDKITKLLNGKRDELVPILSRINKLIGISETMIKDTKKEQSTIYTPFAELTEIINRLTDKKKDRIASLRVLNYAKENEITTGYSETDGTIHFFKKSLDIAKLKITRSNATLIFFNRVKGQITYNNEHESIKNNDYHIILNETSDRWEIIKHRFNN